MRNPKKGVGAFVAVLVTAGAWAGCGGDISMSGTTADAGGAGGGGGAGGRAGSGVAGALGGAGGIFTDGGKEDGASETGGTSGTGGRMADAQMETGDASSTGDGGPLYSLTACPGVTPMAPDLSALRTCEAICTSAHCVPDSVPLTSNVNLQACPDGTSKCVPDAITALNGDYVKKSCVSTLDPNMAGTCVPQCFIPPMYQGVVTKEDCTGTEDLCAPCTNPLTMQPTGACDDHCVTPEGGAPDATTSEGGLEASTDTGSGSETSAVDADDEGG